MKLCSRYSRLHKENSDLLHISHINRERKRATYLHFRYVDQWISGKEYINDHGFSLNKALISITGLSM